MSSERELEIKKVEVLKKKDVVIKRLRELADFLAKFQDVTNKISTATNAVGTLYQARGLLSLIPKLARFRIGPVGTLISFGLDIFGLILEVADKISQDITLERAKRAIKEYNESCKEFMKQLETCGNSSLQEKMQFGMNLFLIGVDGADLKSTGIIDGMPHPIKTGIRKTHTGLNILSLGINIYTLFDQASQSFKGEGSTVSEAVEAIREIANKLEKSE